MPVYPGAQQSQPPNPESHYAPDTGFDYDLGSEDLDAIREINARGSEFLDSIERK